MPAAGGATPPPGPAGDSAEAAARQSAAVPPRPAQPAPRPTEDVLDLGEASREAVLKRVVPLAAGLAGLILLVALRRRR